MRTKPALVFLLSTFILPASCGDHFYENICDGCEEDTIVKNNKKNDSKKDTKEKWEEDFDDDDEDDCDECDHDDDCDDRCVHSGFFIKNIDKKKKVHAYIGWRKSDNKDVRKKITLKPREVYYPDKKACYKLHAYSSSKSKKENWSKMSKKSREKWCKRLGCADYKSKHYWDEVYPMKYKGSVCVCDID
jgi:hypothetical protein